MLERPNADRSEPLTRWHFNKRDIEIALAVAAGDQSVIIVFFGVQQVGQTAGAHVKILAAVKRSGFIQQPGLGLGRSNQRAGVRHLGSRVKRGKRRSPAHLVQIGLGCDNSLLGGLAACLDRAALEQGRHHVEIDANAEPVVVKRLAAIGFGGDARQSRLLGVFISKIGLRYLEVRKRDFRQVVGNR